LDNPAKREGNWTEEYAEFHLLFTCFRSNYSIFSIILKKEELRKAALCFAYLKITPQEKACLAVMRVCIFIIMDIIAWELCITRLETIIFFSLHALNWADYTIYISEKLGIDTNL